MNGIRAALCWYLLHPACYRDHRHCSWLHAHVCSGISWRCLLLGLQRVWAVRDGRHQEPFLSHFHHWTLARWCFHRTQTPQEFCQTFPIPKNLAWSWNPSNYCIYWNGIVWDISEFAGRGTLIWPGLIWPGPAAPGAASLTAGFSHTCSLLADGRVYCWGANDFGQLGLANSKSATWPAKVALIGSGGL
jgi:alpha-tubulin suppressor-like RCC1 family protein